MKINIEDEQGKIFSDDYNQIHFITKKGERVIGRIKEEGNHQVYYKSEPKSGIFRRTNAWSLCYSLLKELSEKDIVKIKLRETGVIYFLTVKECLEKGDFLWFRSAGIEKKLYIKLSDWHKEGEKVEAH